MKLFQISVFFLLFAGCSTMNIASKNAKKMLGLSEIEIKQRMGMPSQQFVDKGYTVMVYAQPVYVNLYQYGSINKYNYTVFWLRSDVCTNWLVREEQVPPEQVDVRVWGNF
jgi:hypothetical protein